jgi:hypothetical protein
LERPTRLAPGDRYHAQVEGNHVHSVYTVHLQNKDQ